MFRKHFTIKLRTAGMLLALLAGVLASSACNTWHGAGKDVEKTSDAMQGK